MTGKAERYTADTPAPEDWWAGPENAPDLEALADYTETDGVMALERLSSSLHTLNDALAETDLTVADAARYMAERLDMDSLAGTVAIVQDLKRRLGLVEAYVARQAGLAAVEMELPREGTLADGRTWTLKRGKDRKAWDHEDWKRDTRLQVQQAIEKRFAETGDLVDTTTGEAVHLGRVIQEAVAQAQEVHGSTAPRVTALKALGLTPGDYCEESPGTWTFQAVAPSTTETTTDSGE